MTATPPSVEDALLPVIQELLPCPWCGHLGEIRDIGATSECWAVGCFNGDCKIGADCVSIHKAEAIKAWNHRTRSTPLEGAELVGRLTDARRRTPFEPWAREAMQEAATAISALKANTQRLLAGWNEAEDRLGSANALARATGEQLDYANRQIKALEAEVGRLREGLRPFADFISAVESAERLPQPVEDYDCVSVQVGLLRRARRLIEGEGI